MKLKAYAGLIAALVLVAGAMPAAAKNPGAVAADACQRSVAAHITKRMNASRAQFLDAPRLKQVSNAETGVSGRGQMDTKRGWTPFSYSCVYNFRSGKTGNISVKAKGGGGGGGGNVTAGQAVGAIIGAAIAGAIIESIDKGASSSNTGSNDSGWFSPAKGITCNSYQSACYKNGRFDAHWTHTIYR